MEAILARCPDCADDTEHELLKESASNLTVQCLDCDRVHSFSPKRAKVVSLPLVISDGDQSMSDALETFDQESIAVGDEFEHGDHRMMVTGMEGHDGRHHDRLDAKDIKVLHAKLFDTVPLKMSVNEKEVTKSYRLEVSPERAVSIGEIIAVDGRKLKVKTLKSDQNRTLHKGFLLARNIRRAFCDEVPHWVKEGKIMPVRKRGRPAGAEAVPRHGRKR
ncbi:MAG: HVO_0476 family zinc finger protein [Thermoplasmatota archaeon]